MPKAWEVEQKFRVVDEHRLLQELAGQNFELQATTSQADTYLQHPSRDFRQTDEALRVRVQDKSAVVTYKGARLEGPVKTRPEVELPLREATPEQWLDLFHQLGFSDLPTVRKTRQEFASPATSAQRPTKVAVDTVESLGKFAEIEVVVSEQQDVAAAAQEVQALATQLGLTEIVTESYLAQLLKQLGHPAAG